MTFLARLCALAILGLLARPAAAQSLAEVARKEEARRKTVKAPAKVYTNDDLRRAGGGIPAPAPAATAPAGAAKEAAQNPQEPKAPEKEDPKKDEAYWRGRFAAARAQLERSKTLLQALESRVNALNTDFVNRDDPAQRGVIANDRQKALAEIERVKKEIVEQTKAIADIEEEARRAGVPAGWLR